jgi:O-antigen/teichoic acid export membrane protein
MKLPFFLKNRNFKAIASNSIRNVIIPFSGIIVSIIVISNFSVSLWGEFINYQIWIGLIGVIVSFGHNEFLLRKFASVPAGIRAAWQSNVLSRLPILTISVLGFYLIHSHHNFIYLLIIWLIFNYINKSFEPLILYKKLFLPVIFVELIILCASAFYLLLAIDQLSIDQIILVYCGASILRCFGLAIFLYKDSFKHFKIIWDIENLSQSVPFFSIGLIGMLNSRIDLYIVNIFLSDGEVGTYQVVTSFLVQLQGFAGFILGPFVKNIYRVSHQVNQRLSWKMLALGLVITLVSLPILYFLLERFYHIQIGWHFYLVFIPYIVPIFYSIPIIYLLYKLGMEKRVTTISGAKLIFNTGLILLLIFPYGILGAFLACAVSNVLVSSYYGFARHKLVTQELR